MIFHDHDQWYHPESYCTDADLERTGNLVEPFARAVRKARENALLEIIEEGAER